MKAFVASLFAAASLAVLPMPAAVALDVAKVTCGPDVPEEWKRPGGYCEKIEGGSSLSGFVDCDVLLREVYTPSPFAIEGIELAGLHMSFEDAEVSTRVMLVGQESTPCREEQQGGGRD